MPDKKDAGRPSFARRMGKVLLIATLSIAGALVLLEVGLRIYFASHPNSLAQNTVLSADPDYSYELIGPFYRRRILKAPGWIKLVLHPYVFYKNLPDQHTALYNINSLGLRGLEIKPVKEPNVYRIIITGNSAAFGVGSSSDLTTLPARLEAKLNSPGAFPRRVEVINAGVIGYLTVQELLYLQVDLLDLDPDLVIAYTGHNDFISPAQRTRGCAQPLEEPPQLRYNRMFYTVEQFMLDNLREADQDVPSKLVSVLGLLAKRTALGQWLEQKLGPAALLYPPVSRVEAATAVPAPECAEKIIDGFTQSVTKMSRLAADENIKWLLVVQPELTWKRQPSAAESRVRQDLFAAHPWYEKAAADIYSEFLKSGRAAATQEGARFLDLSRVFDGRSETVFIDPAHLNDAGNDIVAQALADYLGSDATFFQR